VRVPFPKNASTSVPEYVPAMLGGVKIATENVPVSAYEQLLAENVPDRVVPLTLPSSESRHMPKIDFIEPVKLEPVTVPAIDPVLSCGKSENVSANCPEILLPDCVTDNPRAPDPAMLSLIVPE
jgi:hypothetical protein